MAEDREPEHMHEHEVPAPELRANRRKEVFRAIRGTKLTGQRGKNPIVGGRVRLGSPIEGEADGGDAADPRRYSEPND